MALKAFSRGYQKEYPDDAVTPIISAACYFVLFFVNIYMLVLFLPLFSLLLQSKKKSLPEERFTTSHLLTIAYVYFMTLVNILKAFFTLFIGLAGLSDSLYYNPTFRLTLRVGLDLVFPFFDCMQSMNVAYLFLVIGRRRMLMRTGEFNSIKDNSGPESKSAQITNMEEYYLNMNEEVNTYNQIYQLSKPNI